MRIWSLNRVEDNDIRHWALGIRQIISKLESVQSRSSFAVFAYCSLPIANFFQSTAYLLTSSCLKSA
jgi:hypothetical protein